MMMPTRGADCIALRGSRPPRAIPSAPLSGCAVRGAKRRRVRFLLGVNYWPRSSAMRMWTRFDQGEIDEDFARIAALGLDVVRIFLRWDDFQPEPDRIDPVMLARLDFTLDRAEEVGLRVMPTLFSGHMSGVNWLPEWTLDRTTAPHRFRTICGAREIPHGIGDFYVGPLLAAQRFQARTLAERYRGHPAILAWDLGNEFSNLRPPASAADAADWSRMLADDLRQISGHDVTGGIHGEDLTAEKRIRPSSICAPWSYATMHGYSVYSDFARDRLDVEVVPYLAALTARFSEKRVLFSEFGNPTCPPGTRPGGDRVALPPDTAFDGSSPASRADPDGGAAADAAAAPTAPFACLHEDEMATYALGVLDRLHARGALGAFWWCWADYAAALRDEPPFDRAAHELHFGLVRDDGAEKPVARALAAFAAERRETTEAADGAMLPDEAAFYAAVPSSVAAGYDAYLGTHAAENASSARISFRETQ